MAEKVAEAEVRQALFDLQRYLSDQLAPLMAMGSVELLVRYPPELVAREIGAWVDAQFRGPAADLDVSDYLFHAVKKIHLMSEFELIPQDRMDHYVMQLGAAVLELCPLEDQKRLTDNLSRIGQSETGAAAAPVEILHRQTGGGGAAAHATGGGRRGAGHAQGSPADPADDVTPHEVARNLNRFGMLVDRLEQSGPGKRSGEGGQIPGELLNQVLSAAAVGSRSGSELDGHMQRLNQLGVHAGTAELFRSLGAGLPGWSIPAAIADTAAAELPSNRSLDAMHRIVTMAEDPEEEVKRLTEMIRTATEQFNEGHLVQAMKMFELAGRIIGEKKLDGETVKSMLGDTHKSLSTDQLQLFAEIPERHAELRVVLSFFPALCPDRLLEELMQEEEQRDQRQLVLALLEVHGSGARDAALDQLDTFAGNDTADPMGYRQRNLIYLLRRIPREEDTPWERELGFLDMLCSVGNPMIVIKESVGALAAINNEPAGKLLATRLREFEEALLNDETVGYGKNELRGLIDRMVTALARFGTPNPTRAVVRHAFTRQPRFGNTMARLSRLSELDLSFDKKLVSHLVETVKQELPTKVLGFVVQKKKDHVVHLVRSLSSTPARPVQQLFQEIVARFPGQEFSDVARRALDNFGAPSKLTTETRARSMSGDVELFGLPNLFQTLADSKLTGILALIDMEGNTIATMAFEGGGIQACTAGQLKGEEAFYQVFEKPTPGSFNFNGIAESEADEPEQPPLIEVLPALLEALRRHDEFQHARVIVPDDATLKASGTKPTRVTDEPDAALMRAVWKRAAAGAHPAALESELPVDSFRIRRLYAHWVEETALVPA